MPVPAPVGASQREDGAYDVLFTDGNMRTMADSPSVRQLASNAGPQRPPVYQLDQLPRAAPARPAMPTPAQIQAIGQRQAAAIAAPATPTPAEVLGDVPPSGAPGIAPPPAAPPGGPSAGPAPITAPTGPAPSAPGVTPSPGPAMPGLPRGARMVPQSVTRQTEGAIDPSTPAGRGMLEAYQGQMGALDKLGQAQQDMAALQSEQARTAQVAEQARQAELQRKVQEAEARQAKIEADHRAQLQAANDLVQQQADRKVDQSRVMKDAGVMGVLSVILGGIGAGMVASGGGNPVNYALQTLNARIDADIKAQQDEIARGNAKANNDLKRIIDTYGFSRDEAANVLKLTNLELLQSKSAEVMAQNQSQIAKQQGAILMAGIDKEKADVAKQMYAAQVGKQTTVEQMRLQMPGGGRPNPLEQLKMAAQASGYETSIMEDRAKQAIAEYRATHNGQDPPKAMLDKLQQDRQEYGKTLAGKPGLLAAEAGIQNYAEAVGGKYDPKTGELTLPEDLPNAGPLDRMTPNLSGEAKRIADAEANLVENLGTLRSGSAVSTEQREAIANPLAGLSEPAKRAALKAYAKEISRGRAELSAGYGPEVTGAAEAAQPQAKPPAFVSR